MKPRLLVGSLTLLVVVVVLAIPAYAQSCGDLGGDYCSSSGSCPAGYNSLGPTYDCNPCCQSRPSCGALGGNYCSPSGSCPPGYSSLGPSYDCVTCCQSGPSCGALGGNYCSSSGSCPTSYRSLGSTYDCSPCCQQLSGQSMTGRVYVYSDAGSDFSVAWGRGTTDSDYNVYGHQYNVTTTIRSPKGRTSTAYGSRSTSHSEATASLSWDDSDLGDYMIESVHTEYCPYVNQEWQLPRSRTVISLHVSYSCWLWIPSKLISGASGGYKCKYETLARPCEATCIPPEDPTASVPSYPYDGSCPGQLLWGVPYFIFFGHTICSPGGIGAPAPICGCGDQ